jgi:membrane-anchored mycosin MYCP
MSDNSAPKVSQLVVAWTSGDRVAKMLERLEVDGVHIAESDETLDLVLIEFNELPDGWCPKGWEDGYHKFEAPQDALDRVLVHLRHSFSSQYRGWVPAMGKNRPLGGVASANGQFGGGGAGEPEPVEIGEYSPKNAGLAGNESAAAELGRGARVAVLDTALFPSPLLGDTVSRSADAYLSGDGPFYYLEGHATYIDGLIAAKAPSVELRNTAVLTGEHCTADAWSVAKEMAKLAHTDAQVLNMSMGCFTDDNRPPFVLRRAVEALTPQIVIVAAAGNHREPDNPQPYWPAALDNVLAVGAYDETKNLLQKASFSPRAAWVDVEAPGVDVVSLYLDGPVKGFSDEKQRVFHGAAMWEGTSAAAATVSGVIAANLGGSTTAPAIARRMRSQSVDVVRPYITR